MDGTGLSWMGGLECDCVIEQDWAKQLVESIEELAKDGAARLRPRGEDALLRLLPALHANMVAHLEISAVFSSMIADEH